MMQKHPVFIKAENPDIDNSKCDKCTDCSLFNVLVLISNARLWR